MYFISPRFSFRVRGSFVTVQLRPCSSSYPTGRLWHGDKNSPGELWTSEFCLGEKFPFFPMWTLPVYSLFSPFFVKSSTPHSDRAKIHKIVSLWFSSWFFWPLNEFGGVFFRRCLNIRLRVSPWCGLKAKSVVNPGTGIPLCRRRWSTLRKSRGCHFNSICYCVCEKQRAHRKEEVHIPLLQRGWGSNLAAYKI